jgi:hypothetical protein
MASVFVPIGGFVRADNDFAIPPTTDNTVSGYSAVSVFLWCGHGPTGTGHESAKEKQNNKIHITRYLHKN